MSAFKNLLTTSKHIIAVAGAGLSSASGIPTFRGAGGMWRKYDALTLATPEAFHDNPSRVWQFYHYRREAPLRAQPNDAHCALARFSIPSVRHQISPGSTFTLITQNVDGLSERALENLSYPVNTSIPSNESQPVLLEMHGRLFDVVCTAHDCGHREANFDSPICPALTGTEDLIEAGVAEPNIPLSALPRCRKCGVLARPGVVWFGETPQYLDEIDALVEKADLCLVVGTSSTVYPAVTFAPLVEEHGGKVAVFNLYRSMGDAQADFLFLGPCERMLPEALGISI